MVSSLLVVNGRGHARGLQDAGLCVPVLALPAIEYEVGHGGVQPVGQFLTTERLQPGIVRKPLRLDRVRQACDCRDFPNRRVGRLSVEGL